MGRCTYHPYHKYVLQISRTSRPRSVNKKLIVRTRCYTRRDFLDLEAEIACSTALAAFGEESSAPRALDHIPIVEFATLARREAAELELAELELRQAVRYNVALWSYCDNIASGAARCVNGTLHRRGVVALQTTFHYGRLAMTLAFSAYKRATGWVFSII